MLGVYAGNGKGDGLADAETARIHQRQSQTVRRLVDGGEKRQNLGMGQGMRQTPLTGLANVFFANNGHPKFRVV
jgi:hypothetical protein